MVLQSQTRIRIGSKEIKDYKSLAINQAIDAHHTLQLLVDLRNLEPESDQFSFESKKFLGEKISISINTLAHEESMADFEFDGIITEIRNVKGTDDWTKDEVIIIAKSPTIILDNGPHFTSYKDLSLTEMIDNIVLAHGEGNLNFDVIPMDDTHIYYSVQSGESSFAYLSRLAAQNGEWLYYDGKQMLFGAPGKEEVELKRSFDLKSFDISIKPIAQCYAYFDNDYLSNETFSSSSDDFDNMGNEYSAFANSKSQQMFDMEHQIWMNLGNEINVEADIERGLQKQKNADEINQVRLTGISENPAIKLGHIVVIEGKKYRVISIHHRDTKDGMYENRFVAISAEFDAYPKTNITAHPHSVNQSAIVIDNVDPEGLGRVIVQFPWQKKNDGQTQWVRIVTPHAGADKGFQFIPEIGEEVLIGFEGGNAERPFVLGSLYHGKAKSEEWQTQKNDIKAIRTRSGHTIELNDTEGEEKIKIYDNEGSIIIFDTQAKSLVIESAENLDLVAKNINISAHENINLQAKGDILTASEGNTLLQTEAELSIQAADDVNVLSDANVNIEATSAATVKGQEALLEGQTAADVKSPQTTVEGQMTTLQGASGKIEIV